MQCQLIRRSKCGALLNHHEKFLYMTILTRGIMLLYYTPVTFIKEDVSFDPPRFLTNIGVNQEFLISH
jgi:hypothetical protein